MEFVEIMAEKLRALIDRGYPRDYYDVSSHIDKVQDKPLLRELTKRKCRLIGIRYEPKNIFDDALLARVEEAWRTRLEHLLPHYIEFKTILPVLKTKLAFLLTS